MLQISDVLIVNHSNSPQTYKQGMEYYRRGRIQSVRILEEKNVILADVRGTRDYAVRMAFDDRGVFQDATCTCPAANRYWGYCKHIVAVLLHLKWLKENDGFRTIVARKTAREIFRDFAQPAASIKTPVYLEPIYEFRSHASDYGTNSLLSFKIGTGKRYVVRNIQRLFSQLEAGAVVEFGKSFVFDPYIHEFAEADRPLAEFLKELYEISRLGGPGGALGIFREKYVLLQDTLVKRFFRMMGASLFSAVIDGQPASEMRIQEGEIPVQFRLDSQSGALDLDIDFDGVVHAITGDGEYMLQNSQIYHVPPAQGASLLPFLRAMQRMGSRRLTFLKEHMERFVSEILPIAERAGAVEVSDSVRQMILKEDLMTQVYLDKDGNDIVARIKYIYGTWEINPFDPRPDAFAAEGQILVRDAEGERSIVSLFEQHGFTVQPGSLSIQGDDRIFEFLYSGLPRLSQLAQVFYSEDFKIRLRDRMPCSAGLRLSEDTDLLEFTFNIGGLNGRELDKIFAALREKRRYYRLKDGSYLSLDVPELVGLANLTDHLELKGKDLEAQTIKLPKYRALYLDRQLKDSGITDIKKNRAYQRLIRDIREPGELEMEVPDALKNTLRDYQRVGFKWLKTISYYGMGGILADDMGLGKTLQVLTLLYSERNESKAEPSLVVAPTSLIYNWEAEVQKFVPDLRTLVIAGSKEERLEKMKAIPETDLVITSYPLIRRDLGDYDAHAFRYCFIDEAQHIKNPASQGAKAMKAIRSKYRFALTGTPMENSLTELWSLFDFVMPGYLFTHGKFMQRYERPIVKDRDEDTAAELARQIQPFILRRLKTDVLKELPEKIENKVVVELTEEQKKVYLAYLSRVRSELTEELNQSGFQRSQIKIIAALTRLRQICCHPGMFLEEYAGDSGKLQLLEEIVTEALEGGHRILLFSQFTTMLAIIRRRLKSMQVHALYLDGNTETLERGRLVKEFNAGQGDVFLISLKAGGTGLNLTGADTVIHYDPWWNPAVEDQASDRAYRIGQKRVVHVMRLIAKGTIEEKIEKLKENKRNLTDAVIHPGETFLSKMTEQEVRALFEL